MRFQGNLSYTLMNLRAILRKNAQRMDIKRAQELFVTPHYNIIYNIYFI